MAEYTVKPLPEIELSPHLQGILARLDESAAELDQCISMPPDVYTSEEWFEFEKRAVWDTEWICLGHQGLVPEVGDYVRININDDPLLVIKQKDKSIRVLSAVCQHRGHLLGDEKGNAKILTCPFHAWAYDMEGTLMAAPEMEAHASLEELKKDFCLPSLRTEIWNGFIFVNLDGNARPLAQRLKRLTKEVANHHLDTMGAVPTVDWGPSPWNWKFMHENAIEPHHTRYLHRGPHDFAPSRLASFADWDENDDGAIYHPTGFLYEDGNFTAAFRCMLPIIETLTNAERKRVMFACILPNLFFGAVPDGCFYYCVLPQGPNEMTIRVGYLYPDSTLRNRNFEHIFPAVVDGLSIYNDQDTVANSLVHLGLKSRFANRGRYAPKEATLPQFNRWLISRYKAYANSISHNGR